MHTGLKLATLLLGLAMIPAWAQPPEGKGPVQAPGKVHQQPEHQGKEDDGRRRYDTETDWRRDNPARVRREEYRREPRIDESSIRLIFREHRDWIDYDHQRDALPPGIRMNLQRGKSLPPGIAKRFDPRLRERLPYYEGYEWRRVGDNAVLIDIATQNVRFILEGIL